MNPNVLGILRIRKCQTRNYTTTIDTPLYIIYNIPTMDNSATKERRGLLIILSGPSGVGKGTVRKYIMEDESLDLVYSVSLTTRSPRNNEVDGLDYHFVSRPEFEKYIAEDNLLEWAEFVGNYYGTPRDYVDKMRDAGKNVILEIEVEGTKQVLDKERGHAVFSVFLIPPTFEELKNRIENRRSESNQIIQERLEKAEREIGLKYHYHYVVLNDDAKRAAAEIQGIIRSKINAEILP